MKETLNQKFNQYLYNIQGSAIRVFDEKVSKIEGIIKLTLGEPDFATPEHVKQAGIAAIENNVTKYTPTPGFPALRHAIANFLEKKYGLSYNGENEIIVTHGATEALSVVLKAIINPGDKILIPSPFFTLYASMITLYGGEAVLLDTSANGFVLSPEQLKKALEEHGTAVKAIMLNYPTNPTGITWNRQEAEAIAALLKDQPLFVISDEVYSEFVYEGAHVSIAELLPEQTVLINGVSKSHSMTGWRIGFICAPSDYIAQMVKVHQNFVTNPTSISQMAALEALENGMDDTLEMKAAYNRRRDFVYQNMKEMGFTINRPNGAFYVFAKIPQDLEQDAFKFCLELAEHSRVALIPGDAFGKGGEHHVRLSYAASDEHLAEAMKRMKEFVEYKRQNG